MSVFTKMPFIKFRKNLIVNFGLGGPNFTDFFKSISGWHWTMCVQEHWNNVYGSSERKKGGCIRIWCKFNSGSRRNTVIFMFIHCIGDRNKKCVINVQPSKSISPKWPKCLVEVSAFRIYWNCRNRRIHLKLMHIRVFPQINYFLPYTGNNLQQFKYDLNDFLSIQDYCITLTTRNSIQINTSRQCMLKLTHVSHVFMVHTESSIFVSDVLTLYAHWLVPTSKVIMLYIWLPKTDLVTA